MSALPYRLVALDIDGTLLDSRSQVHPANRAVLAELVARGAHVALATGKSWPTALRFASALGLPGPQIANDGAAIADPASRRLVREVPIDAGVTKAAIRLAREIGVTLFVERGGETLVEAFNDDAEYLMEHGNPAPRVVADMTHELDPPAIQFYVVAYRKDALHDRALAAFRERFDGDLNIFTSSAWYIDMVKAGVSKGTALAELARTLGVPKSQVVALGDGQNDIGMFEAAGVSVAMGQAAGSVKAAASMVTGTNDEGGVAQALRRLFQLDGV